MIKLDTYLFGAICCEAAFGLLVTVLIIKALISTLIYGDDEKGNIKGSNDKLTVDSALKEPRDARVEDNCSRSADGNNRQEANGKETQPAGRKTIGVIIVVIFIIGFVLGGWLFYCLFPNTAISKDELREATEKFEEAQAVKNEYGLGKNYFETPIEYGGCKMFKVGGVLENGDALATEVTSTSNNYISTLGGVQVVLEHSPEMPYYDSQLVSAPEGKAVIQLGVYRSRSHGSIMMAEDLLSSGSGSVKTLPILAIR